MNVLIGRYIPKESFIHDLDPRFKLLITLIFMILIFIPIHLYTYGLYLLFIFGIYKMSNLSFSLMKSVLKPMRFLIVFMVIFTLLFSASNSSDILLEFYFIKITMGSLNYSILLVLRIITLVLFSSLLTFTTTPMQLTDAIEYILKPFEKIKVPSHEIAMMISIAIRFIPTIFEEVDKIMKAQASRGVDFIDSKLKEKVVAIIALIIPLFLSAFKRADDLANAMEARGYQGGNNRSKYRILKWRKQDSLALITLIIIFTIFVLLDRL